MGEHHRAIGFDMLAQPNARLCSTKQPAESRLALGQRSPADVLAIGQQKIEGIRESLVIVHAGMQRVEIANAVLAGTAALGMTACLTGSRAESSTIQAQRSLQSTPVRVNRRTRR